MKVPMRDMSLHLAYLDLHLGIVAQGVGWNPDIADDMVNRMKALLDQSLYTLHEYGHMGDSDDEEFEFGPTPDSELIDPRIIYVEDDDG